MEPGEAAGYFHKRIHCVERLVRNVADQVALVDPKAAITSQRSVDPRPPVSNLLTIRVAGQEIQVRDLWPHFLRPPMMTDKDNLALIVSAQQAFADFEKVVTDNWPQATDGIRQPFERAQINIIDACRASFSVSERMAKHPVRRALLRDLT